MICRALGLADYADARSLYEVLSTGESLPDFEAGETAFAKVIEHAGTTILGAEIGGKVVSMATLHLLPNMTYGARPYGLVENVATLHSYAGQGMGRAVMQAVADAAWAADAYKIMLLTGQSNDATGFYVACGYDADEKHGMILRRSTANGR